MSSTIWHITMSLDGFIGIYDGYADVALDMITSRTFDGRIQLLEYVPTILAGPPGSLTGSA